MEKKEEKEFEYLNAHMNRLWVGVMVLGGGLAGIVFSSHFKFSLTLASIIKFSIFILGFLILIGMLNGLANIKSEIYKKLKGDL